MAESIANTGGHGEDLDAQYGVQVDSSGNPAEGRGRNVMMLSLWHNGAANAAMDATGELANLER
jgi:hypothetical protein